MRLWHKDLIPVLPRQQLLAQWRECCCIAKNIAMNGTPNYILVNKILDYPMCHFISYSHNVYLELLSRGYNVDWGKFEKHILQTLPIVFHDELFVDWHNDRYLTQCFYNLQEKYDCGGISDDEWDRVYKQYIGGQSK